MKRLLYIVPLLLLSLFCAGQSVKYVYDNARRLTKLIRSDGSGMEYVYDANDNRIKVAAILPCKDRPIPKITPADSVKICEGDSVQLLSDVASAYLWSTGAITRSIIVKAAGVYTVVVTAPSGCSDSIKTIVGVLPRPKISLQPIATQTVCKGGSPNALVLNATGNGTVRYQWYANTMNSTSGGVAISGAITSSYLPPKAASTGTTYYYCAISDSNTKCAPVYSTISSVVVTSLSIQQIPSQAICQFASPDTLKAIVSGGGPALSYQWYVNSTNSTSGGSVLFASTMSTYVPSTILLGTSYYYVTVTPSGQGCESLTSNVARVQVSAPVVPSVTVSFTCSSGAVLFSSTITDGGAAPLYQWQIKRPGESVWLDSIGATGTTFVIQKPVIGTKVRCRLTSNAPCTTSPVVFSDSSIINCVVTAIPIIDGMERFAISPNPNKGAFSVNMKFNTITPVAFKVVNETGQVVHAIRSKNVFGFYTQHIRLPQAVSGTYYLVTTIRKTTFAEKIIVVR